MFVWPLEGHRAVLKSWQAWTRSVDEDITTSFRIMDFPAAPELSPLVAGRPVLVIDGVFAGVVHQAQEP